MKDKDKSVIGGLVKGQETGIATTKRRTYYFESILLILIASFLTLAFLVRQTPYFPFDLSITKSIQQISFPGFSTSMIFLTTIGNVEWAVLTIIGVVIFFASLGKNFNALFFVISVGGAEALSLSLKAIIGRPRPAADLIKQLGTYLVHDSFPSGHVLYFVGCFGFLYYLSYSRLKKGKLRDFYQVFFLLLIIGIGISRIYVGAHWFSDTLGAYLIGTVWLLIVIHFYQKYMKKYMDKG